MQRKASQNHPNPMFQLNKNQKLLRSLKILKNLKLQKVQIKILKKVKKFKKKMRLKALQFPKKEALRKSLHLKKNVQIMDDKS